jgi:hypothetical protein
MKYRELYPDDWEERAYQLKEAVGWQCQWCGIAHRAQAISQRTGQVYTVYLAAVHLDHDPWNPNARLAVLCPSCHMSYDYSRAEQQRWLELEIYRHQVLVNAYLARQQAEDMSQDDQPYG